MFEEDAIIQINSSSDNLLKLIECRERVKDESVQTILDAIIKIEANVIYIETTTVCVPIIDEYNKKVASPKADVVKGNVVSLKKPKDETLL